VVNQVTKTQEVIAEVLTTKDYMIVAANHADKLARALQAAIEDVQTAEFICQNQKLKMFLNEILTRIERIMGGGDETDG
jgi:50S ribosomal subunit-associated GTPase HflX